MQSFKRLGETEEDKQEADTHAHVGRLIVTHLDAIEVESAHCVG